MRTLPLLALLLSGNALACTQMQIEAATELVLQANPVILAERDEFTEQARQRSWSTQLALGYSLTNTLESGEAGPNASLRVVIPLFDRAHELKRIKARSAFQRRQDSVLADFLGQLEKLCSQADQVRELETMRRFYRDRLQYRQEQVMEGLAEADSLWQETEKVQQVEHDYRRERGELAARQLAVARRFGGEQWKRLQALLVESSN